MTRKPPTEAEMTAFITWNDAYKANYAAWLAAGRPMHLFAPDALVLVRTCTTCGGGANSGTHPPGITSAQALAELDSRPSTGPGTGFTETITPVELTPLRRLARARRWELQEQGSQLAEALAQVDALRTYANDAGFELDEAASAYVAALETLADAVRTS